MAAPQRTVDKDAVGLWGRHERLAELTVCHALPAVYQFRRFVAAGGLMSYGSSETEYYHLTGPTPENFSGVTSRPNLPVQQSNLINAEAG
jgi:putative ABC transport system substrate-binding protein